MTGITQVNEVKRMNRRFMTGALAVLTGVSSVAMVCPMTALASSSFAMRKKTVKSANIIDSVDVNKESNYVTRKEFAKMLVMASSYRSAVSAYNDVAVFSDVAKDDAYASYIRVATEQGWMTAFLGGKFKPDETVSFGEAVKGCLALLGYTNDSFSGNQLANRVTKAQAIGLSEDIAKTSLTDAMSYQDCINLFYNLLKTNTAANENKTKASNTIYGELLGFSLTSDNELNMLETLESNLKGPYVLKAGKSLHSIIPFKESAATCYLNGVECSVTDIEEAAESYAAVAVYYNASTKSVYAYSDQNESGTMGTATGDSFEIYYDSANVMTPTYILLNGVKYYIKSTDMQYAFSIYGTADKDDDITIVWQMSSGSDGSTEKEVIAFVQ